MIISCMPHAVSSVHAVQLVQVCAENCAVHDALSTDLVPEVGK